MTFNLFMPLTSCMFNFQQLTQTGKYCYSDSWVVWDVLFLYLCRFKWVVWTVLKGLQEYTTHVGWWKRGLEKLEAYGFFSNSVHRPSLYFILSSACSKSELVANIEPLRIHISFIGSKLIMVTSLIKCQ